MKERQRKNRGEESLSRGGFQESVNPDDLLLYRFTDSVHIKSRIKTITGFLNLVLGGIRKRGSYQCFEV
jgi:hypothetical protein